MKAPHPSSQRGLTLLEVLVVIGILMLLVVLILPVLAREHPARRTRCVYNLKNIGLALRIFSADHAGAWPMDVSVTNNGTREWTTDGSQLWRHWLALSNELTTPKLLLCPADLQRQPSKPFFSGPKPLTWTQSTNNSHLSYFLALNASEEQPQTILAGDRNLTTNGIAVGPGRLVLTTNMVLGFTAEIHGQAGNVLLSDGSVQQVNGGRLSVQWRAASTESKLATNVWLVP